MSNIVNDQIANSVYSFEVLPFIREIERTIYAKNYQLAIKKMEALRIALEEVEFEYWNTWEENHQFSAGHFYFPF